MGGMATMLLCTLLFSCNNEELLDNEMPKIAGNSIAFGLSSGNQAQTRGNTDSAENGYTANRFVLRSDNSADTLCARVIVSDGICLSGFEESPALTRAAPVATDNFYDKFHVVAYWKKDGTPVTDRFFLDEDATKNSSTIWNTDKIYYWPGAEHTFQFYAWAPTNADGLIVPTTPQSKQMTYTVPANVAAQKDIVVATTAEIQGNNNAAVPLSFRHICTAVRFTVGEIQAGTIKKVALKGVLNAGTYDMATASWTLAETTADFSQTPNKVMDGTEAAGTAITTAEGTFMMLPQTLPVGAKVEVVFSPTAGEERTLTAAIGGTVWTMGTTVTYRLTITPEYALEFVSEPQVQDAHYVIYPITIKADTKLKGNWTLTSNDPTNVTFVERFAADGIKNLVDQGYWLKDYCGTSTLTSSTKGDEIRVYVFLKENVSTTDRNITLSLAPANNTNPQAVRTFTFNQYCPAWSNGIGVERIQEKDYPWGFNWDASMKITYKMPNGIYGAILHVLFLFFGDHSYIKDEGTAISGTWKVIVDFSKVPKLTTATSNTDGISNTWELYNFEGLNEASTLMNQLESWGGVPDKTLPENPSEYAAWACVKKNRFGVKQKTNAGETVYDPTIQQSDMVWYLPAKDEAASMIDNLSGDYWTSTAITDPGTTAYKYTAGGTTSPEERNNKLHVRAVRKSVP